MTVIQGPMPAAAPNTKLGQSNTPDRAQAEAFGLSMLLALIAPQATPVTQQPTNEGTAVLNTDQHPEGEGARQQQLVTKEEVAGATPAALRRASITRATAELSTLPPTPTPTPTLTPTLNADSGSEAKDVGQSMPDPTHPETRATVPTLPAVDEEMGDMRIPIAKAEAPATRSRGEMPLVSETSQPVKTEPARIETSQTKAAPPHITIESAEISSGAPKSIPETPTLKGHPLEVPTRSNERPIVVTRHAGAGESAVTSNASFSTQAAEEAVREPATPARSTLPPIEGKPVQLPAQDTASTAAPALREELVPKPTQVSEREEQPRAFKRQAATQPQSPERIRPTLTVRERPAVRELSVAGVADLDAGRADATETTRADRVPEHTVERETAQAPAAPKGSPSQRAVPSPQTQTDVAAPVVGVRPNGGLDSTPLNRQESGQVEQTVFKTPADDLAFQPKPEDRVTLKFTDDAGVEGRLRVALRGQSVRATIVSNDPATAERINAGVPELQRALDKQGFRDPQIAVQQTRGSEGAANVAIASGVRAGQEIQGGSSAGRTLEDQANRERQQPSTRDHQHQNSGRSQQRSRERQER